MFFAIPLNANYLHSLRLLLYRLHTLCYLWWSLFIVCFIYNFIVWCMVVKVLKPVIPYNIFSLMTTRNMVICSLEDSTFTAKLHEPSCAFLIHHRLGNSDISQEKKKEKPHENAWHYRDMFYMCRHEHRSTYANLHFKTAGYQIAIIQRGYTNNSGVFSLFPRSILRNR